MKIKRRYVPFCDLYYCDSPSALIIKQAFENSKLPKAEQTRLWDFYCECRVCVATAEMGHCIPNFGYIIDEFEKLDITSPFDNGFTMQDVREVKMVGMDDDSITIELVTRIEGITYPVSVISVSEEQKTNKLVMHSDGCFPFNIED